MIRMIGCAHQGWQSISIQQNQISRTILLILFMNYLRELPADYIDACPLIDGKYRVLFKLGVGRFSKVKMGIQLATNERVAIKIMNHKIDEGGLQRAYQQTVLKTFLNELKMSLEGRHRNTVQIIDFNVGGVYRTADGRVRRILYYVMKIVQNGQFFRIISQTEPFSERTARYIFRQIISALRHLHSRRIAHCDLKTQNILLDARMNIKIADFGYSRYYIDEQCTRITYSASDTIGSAKCNAPELMDHGKMEYQADAVDLFACGCLLFEMVMKAEPFKSTQSKDQHYPKLAGSDKKKFWDIFSGKCNPSAQFKDLIEKLLSPNPKERLSLEEIIKHPWYHGEYISKQDYKKQMSNRVKRVMVKVRKQQQNQIKQAFNKQRMKKEFIGSKIEEFPISIKRQFQDRIIELRLILAHQDSSHSDSSNREHEQPELQLYPGALEEKQRIIARRSSQKEAKESERESDSH